MATAVEIGSLIEHRPEIRAGLPCVAGTGVSVHRVVTWYQLGLAPEEIADTYYHANRQQIDADDAEADELEREHAGHRALAARGVDVQRMRRARERSQHPAASPPAEGDHAGSAHRRAGRRALFVLSPYSP
jgi:uncharacterized protein (DUF433 family)